MALGYEPEDEPQVPGLAGFDSANAAQDVADVYANAERLAALGLTPKMMQQADGLDDPPVPSQPATPSPPPVPFGPPAPTTGNDIIPMGQQGALDEFDVNKAAQGVGDVYRNAAQLTQQGGSEPGGAHNPDTAGSTPAPATASDALLPVDIPFEPNANSTLAGMPAPPAPPKLTGDPTKDVQANTLYQRQLTDYHGQLTRQHRDLGTKVAKIEADRAAREASTAAAIETRRDQERQRYAAERQVRQSAIEQAIGERTAAAKDIEGATWADKNTGMAIFASIAGALGQAFQNVSAAQLGQVGHAQNEGMNTIQRLMDRERATREKRLKMAGDSVLEARYGFKDANDNHRAAMNDLDADLASKWRLVAKEAEAGLRRLGADRAAIEQNEVYATAMQKAAAEEGKIHEREDQRNISREHARATESLARASLAVRRDEAQQKREDKDEQTTVFDAGGKPLGNVKDPVLRREVAGSITSGRDMKRLVGQLRDHIDKHGATLSPSEQLKRASLRSSLLLQAKELEKLGALTGPDVGLVEKMTGGSLMTAAGATGGQLQQLDQLIGERVASKMAAGGLDPSLAGSALVPGSRPSPSAAPPSSHGKGGKPPKGSAAEAASAAAPAAAAPAAAPSTGGVPQKVIDQSWKAIQDPRAPKAVKDNAMKALVAAGLL